MIDIPSPKRLTSARVDQIFNSPPVRKVNGRSRPTQRFGFDSHHSQQRVELEGNELIASLVLEHLIRLGEVRRYKCQPFVYRELGGFSDAVPDLLVELNEGSVHVVEVKAYRYITSEVLDAFAAQRAFLKELGIAHHIWADRDPRGRIDKLKPDTRHAVMNIHRGLVFYLTNEEEELIRLGFEAGCRTLGALIDHTNLSWDAVMCAIAKKSVHINLSEPLNESSSIHASPPSPTHPHFFTREDDAHDWWGTLSHPVDRKRVGTD